MEDTILVCRDSLEGVLTAIYRAYEWKLSPASTRLQIGEADLCLFSEYREVEENTALAAKVAGTVRRKFGAQAWESVCYALASEDAGRGQAVYQTIAAGLSGQIRGPLMGGLANEHIRKTFELSRRVHNEAHRMKEFLRFRELEGKVLFAQIGPDANVVEFIMPHFSDRFPLENFVIADAGRGIAGVHAASREWFMLRMDAGKQAAGEKIAGEDEEALRRVFGSMEGHYSKEELEMAELFRHFCHTIGIKERRNLRLQQQFLPLKYRTFMTEFEKKQQF